MAKFKSREFSTNIKVQNYNDLFNYYTNYFLKFLLNDANSSSSTSSIDRCLCNFDSGEARVEVDCVDTDAESLISDATDSFIGGFE